MYSDMATPDSDGAPEKGEGEIADSKRATTDCHRSSTDTDGNTGDDYETIADGVEKLFLAAIIQTTEKIERERDMKTLMKKMLHKATVMLPMPTVKEQLTMDMELWSMKRVVRATAKEHLPKEILPRAMTTVDERVRFPLRNMRWWRR